MTNETVRVVLEELPKRSLGVEDFIPSIVAALVGTLVALVGTWFVQKRLMRLQRDQERIRSLAERKDRNFSAGNALLFTLQAQSDVLNAMTVQLNKVRDDEERWRRLPHLVADITKTPTLDRSTLGFLIDDAPALARALLALQLDFDSIIAAIQRRNICLAQFLHPHFAPGPKLAPFEQELRTVTEHIYSSIDSTTQDIDTQRKEVSAFLAEHFQKRKTIDT